MQVCLIYKVSIQADFQFPADNMNSITFIIQEREDLNRLIDLSISHGYTVIVKEFTEDEETS